MKVTKAYEMAGYGLQRQNRETGQKKPLSAKGKNVDRFTPAPAAHFSKRDAAQTVSQVADALRGQFPWVSFTFDQLGDRPEDIAQFVASAGNGVHLVIDSDVLEWMAQGEKAWNQGLEMIGKALQELMQNKGQGEYNRGAVIAEDGEITLWSAKEEKPKSDMTDILDRMDEARERQQEHEKKMKLEQKKKLNYQMGKDMARLAKGSTDRDVRSLISSLYANRQKIATSASYNKKEVQAALAQMDYVIGRARAKIRHLKDEGEMQRRIDQAEKRQEEKRRMQLEQELKTRKRNRMAKERAAIYEKLPDLPGIRDEEERREARAEAILGAVASGAIAADSIPAAPPADAGTNVTVSTPGGASVNVTITPMA